MIKSKTNYIMSVLTEAESLFYKDMEDVLAEGGYVGSVSWDKLGYTDKRSYIDIAVSIVDNKLTQLDNQPDYVPGEKVYVAIETGMGKEQMLCTVNKVYYVPEKSYLEGECLGNEDPFYIYELSDGNIYGEDEINKAYQYDTCNWADCMWQPKKGEFNEQ